MEELVLMKQGTNLRLKDFLGLIRRCPDLGTDRNALKPAKSLDDALCTTLLTLVLDLYSEGSTDAGNLQRMMTNVESVTAELESFREALIRLSVERQTAQKAV